MSDISRRDVLRRLALTLIATGTLDRVAAQEVHLPAWQSRAARRLHAEGALGARVPHARAPDRPDHPGRERRAGRRRGRRRGVDRHDGSSENDELKAIYTTGLAWLDAAMKTRGADGLRERDPRGTDRAARSDRLPPQPVAPSSRPGIEFFTWARRMTVDAFYTSEIGIKDIDYRGNRPMMSYPSPTEAIAYALKKSGL